MPETVTAAALIIGNEILSGRTQDQNLSFLGEKLGEIGIRLKEARVVSDDAEEIAAALDALRARYDYVFTTGGIGPTHDDITADSVARAFGVGIDYHPEVYAMLKAWFESKGQEANEARMRMARIPDGAEILDNELTLAPGFQIENVFVLAGVPSIARKMFDGAKRRLRGGAPVCSRAIRVHVGEGTVAEAARRHPGRLPRHRHRQLPVVGRRGLRDQPGHAGHAAGARGRSLRRDLRDGRAPGRRPPGGVAPPRRASPFPLPRE